jgi:hypothetical protein
LSLSDVAVLQLDDILLDLSRYISQNGIFMTDVPSDTEFAVETFIYLAAIFNLEVVMLLAEVLLWIVGEV